MLMATRSEGEAEEIEKMKGKINPQVGVDEIHSTGPLKRVQWLLLFFLETWEAT